MGLGYFINKKLQRSPTVYGRDTYQTIKKEIQKYKTIKIYINNKTILFDFINHHVINYHNDKALFEYCLNVIDCNHFWQDMAFNLLQQHIYHRVGNVSWYSIKIFERKPTIFIYCLFQIPDYREILFFQNDYFKDLMEKQCFRLMENKTLHLTDADMDFLCVCYNKAEINNENIVLYYIVCIDIFDINRFETLFYNTSVLIPGVLQFYTFLFNKKNTLLYNTCRDRFEDVDTLMNKKKYPEMMNTTKPVSHQEKQYMDILHCIHAIVNNTNSVFSLHASYNTWDYIQRHIYTGYEYKYDKDTQSITCSVKETV